jgi:acetylglutamate kinase
MDIVEMVLGGRVNKSLVQLIQQAGGQAVGLSGKDGNMLKARQMVELDIGFVGEVTKVDPTVLETMSRNGFIPVVATIATDDKGQALNINADTAAGEVRGCEQAHLDLSLPDLRWRKSAGRWASHSDSPSIFPSPSPPSFLRSPLPCGPRSWF